MTGPSSSLYSFYGVRITEVASTPHRGAKRTVEKRPDATSPREGRQAEGLGFRSPGSGCEGRLFSLCLANTNEQGIPHDWSPQAGRRGGWSNVQMAVRWTQYQAGARQCDR